MYTVWLSLIFCMTWKQSIAAALALIGLLFLQRAEPAVSGHNSRPVNKSTSQQVNRSKMWVGGVEQG